MTEINGTLPAGAYILPIHINDTLEESRPLTRDIQGIFHPYVSSVFVGLERRELSRLYVRHTFDAPIGDYQGFVCLRSSVEVCDDY